MPLLRPIPMQAASGDTELVYSAQEDRASIVQSIFSREGVVDFLGGDLRVRQRAAGASYQIEVQPGRAAIRGDDVSDQGTYVVANTTTVATLTVPTSTSSQRTHQIVARVRDKLHNAAWTTYDWTLSVLADTSLAAAQALPSTIVLATIVVPANASAVTTAMITDRRGPGATVGTPDQTGTFTLLSAYSASDSTRPLGYSLNKDGWVQLSGWFKRVAAATNLAAQTQYTVTDVPLPAAIQPVVPGYRDFTIVSQLGHLQGSILPSGHLAFLSFSAQTYNTNAWQSLDGCSYHI